MSLESWKKEFYPTVPKKGWTTLKALQHSLRKWEGALPKNLKKHGVFYERLAVSELPPYSNDSFGERMHFDNCSCALCVKYQRDQGEWATEFTCGTCPLNDKGPKGFGCGEGSVFSKSRNDAKPMVRKLRAVLKAWEAK